VHAIRDKFAWSLTWHGLPFGRHRQPVGYSQSSLDGAALLTYLLPNVRVTSPRSGPWNRVAVQWPGVVPPYRPSPLHCRQHL